jgi:hypothetical protein
MVSQAKMPEDAKVKVRVISDDGTVLFDPNGDFVIAPFDENERAAAFGALTAALAVLSGIKLQYQHAAKEVATGEHCSESAQYHSGHKDGVVVRLRERLVRPAGATEPI